MRRKKKQEEKKAKDVESNVQNERTRLTKFFFFLRENGVGSMDESFFDEDRMELLEGFFQSEESTSPSASAFLVCCEKLTMFLVYCATEHREISGIKERRENAEKLMVRAREERNRWEKLRRTNKRKKKVKKEKSKDKCERGEEEEWSGGDEWSVKRRKGEKLGEFLIMESEETAEDMEDERTPHKAEEKPQKNFLQDLKQVYLAKERIEKEVLLKPAAPFHFVPPFQVENTETKSNIMSIKSILN